MYLTVVLMVLAATLLYVWYRNRKERFTVFKSLGISGPEPNILFGNLIEMKDVGQHRKWQDWTEAYGPTFGYYEGPKPILVTSDVDMIKQIMIKEFNKFHSRKPFPLKDPHDKYIDMFDAIGQHWKRIRSISSPSFSTKRMKEMSPLIHTSLTELLDLFKQHADLGEAFDIYGDFQRLTLTVIANVAFGIEINALTNPDNVFLKQARKIFEITEEKGRSWSMTIFIPAAVCFPEVFHKVWHYILPFVTVPRTWFINSAKRILLSRMETKSDRVDFVQLMLDARLEDTPTDLTMTVEEKDTDEDASNDNMTKQNWAKANSPKVNRQGSMGGSKTETRNNAKRLSMEEMQSQAALFLLAGCETTSTAMAFMSYQLAMHPFLYSIGDAEMQSQAALFLLAGYETTSTAMAFMSYQLAMHPDIQETLIAEVDDHFPDKTCEPDYSSVQKLDYMDMVLSEVLRMYPIAAIATTRMATEDIQVSGVQIKKDMIIQANMEAVHFNPEHWGPEDPMEFVPDRFLPERKASRHPCAWLPFGVGPRNCVGMRFAFLEAKLTMVRILKNFTIEHCARTPDTLPVNKVAMVAPSEGVWVKLVKR